MSIPHTKAKHSNGRKDGQRSAGHPRWARAAANAALHPNSKSAILYLTRVTNAFAIAQAVREGNDTLGLDARQPYAHYDLHYVGTFNKEIGRWQSKKAMRRLAVTCGVHCMVMQVQLDYGRSIAASIEKTIIDPKTREEVKKVQPVDRKSLRKGQKCAVC